MRAALFACTLIVAFALAGAAVRAGGPRAHFAGKAFDAGIVPHGTIVRHRFELTNAGAAPLEILNVKTSCGCTAAEPSKRRLLLGETAAIDASFDSGAKSVPNGRQRFANSVMIFTNDPREQDGGPGISRLLLEVDVVARYALIPDAGAFFPPVPSGARSVTATVEVLPAADPIPGEPPVPPLRLEEARVVSSPPGLTIESLRATRRDGREGVAIACAIGPGAPIGVYAGWIVLATGNPRQPEVRVPVRGYVQPPVVAYPPRLFLVRDSPEPRPIRIQATAHPTRVIGAAIVTADGAEPPLELAVSADGQEVRVTPRPPAPGTPAAAGCAGDALLFLEDEAHPLLRVPYLIRDSSGQRAEFEAQRAAGVRVSPGELYLGDIDPALPPPEVQAIAARAGPKPLEPSELAVDPPGAVEASLEPVTAGQIARIRVRPAPAGPGAILARITFRPRPGEPPIGFRAVGRILPRVLAEPEVLQVEAATGAGAVVLRRRDGKPLRALAARDRTGRFDVRVEADARIVATPKPQAPAGEPIGMVEVETDVEGARTVLVPLIDRRGVK